MHAFRPTRRMILLSMLAAACTPATTQTGAPSAPAAPSVPSTAAATATVAPVNRVVKHTLGETTVKVPVSRVIPLDYSFLDALLSMGITPVGAATGNAGGDRGAPAYLKTMGAGIPAVGSRAQPEFETMATLRPDLIIGDQTAQAAIYSQLSQIGPTVVFNSRTGTIDDIFTQCSELGVLTGRSAQAEMLVKEMTARFVEVKTKTPPSLPNVIMAVAAPTTLTIHTTASFVGSMLDRVGRKNGVEPRGNLTQFEVDQEGLSTYKAETLVIFTAPDEDPVVRRWAREALWQSMPAAQKGRIFEFDRDLWTRSRGMRGLKIMVDEMVESGLLSDSAPTEKYRFKV